MNSTRAFGHELASSPVPPATPTVSIPCIDAFAESGEKTLLAVARAGYLEAFERLVMPHQGKVFRLAHRILRNREDAEDVAQAALLQALRHLDGFKGQAQISTWLFRIATNEALMRLRATRRKCETPLDQVADGNDAAISFQAVDKAPNPEENCSARELRAIVCQAVSRLRPIYREVVELRHIQERSAKEISRLLGVPVGTVKARLHRARLTLMRSTRAMCATGARQLAIENRNVAGAAIVRSRVAYMPGQRTMRAYSGSEA